MDGGGNVFVADFSSNAVKEIDIADPPYLVFASTSVGSTSSDSPQTVTVENTGNADLSFVVPSTGNNPGISDLNTSNAPPTLGSDFSLDSSASTACPVLTSTSSAAATLSANASCTISISFIPATAGSFIGSAVLTDTNLNAVAPSYAIQPISFNGTGTAAAATQVATSAVASTLSPGGNLGTVRATVEDANGNTVTTSTATVTVTITGPGGYSQTVSGTAANGVASVNLSSLSLTAPGTYTVTTSSAGLNSAVSTVTVTAAATAGAASKLVLGAVASSITPGQSLGTATATIQDINGNTVTSSSLLVTATLTGPNGFSEAVTGTAVNGIVTLNLTSLNPTAAGTYTLTVSGSGLTPAISTITVAGMTQAQDFGIGMTGGTPSVAVVAGAAASFTLALTPGASGFSGAIALSVTGLPASATYSFSPSTVTLGSAPAVTVLTVQTAKPVATAHNLSGAAGITLALLILPLGLSRKKREALKRTRLLSALGVLLLLGGVAGLSGCGTSNGFLGQPAQSYTVTVTGTSGTLTHSTTVVLNVQ